MKEVNVVKAPRHRRTPPPDALGLFCTSRRLPDEGEGRLKPNRGRGGVNPPTAIELPVKVVKAKPKRITPVECLHDKGDVALWSDIL